MIMAGGTGGHVFPGLAVADELNARDCDVVWLGTHRGLEARLVPQHGIEIEWITIAGVRGRGVLAWISAPFRIAGAVLEALRALRRRNPAAVLGMGGFVAGPGGLAAWLARKPLLIHEQNSVAGTTNRWLAPFAKRVFEAFPGSFPANVHAELIGNPVRRSLIALEAPRTRLTARRAARRRVLVIGGSHGARILNETLPRALAELSRGRAARSLASGRSHRIRGRARRVFVSRRHGARRRVHRRHGWRLPMGRSRRRTRGRADGLGARYDRRRRDPRAVQGRDRRSPDAECAALRRRGRGSR